MSFRKSAINAIGLILVGYCCFWLKVGGGDRVGKVTENKNTNLRK